MRITALKGTCDESTRNDGDDDSVASIFFFFLFPRIQLEIRYNFAVYQELCFILLWYQDVFCLHMICTYDVFAHLHILA